MFMHQFRRAIPITFHKRIEDGLVFAARLAKAIGKLLQQAVDRVMNPVSQSLYHVGDFVVSKESAKQLMKLGVRFDKFVNLLLLHCRSVTRLILLKLPNLLHRQMSGQPAHDIRLERLANLVVIGNVLPGHFSHHNALLGSQRHQAVRFEPFDCRMHWRTTHIEPCSRVPDGKNLSACKLPRENQPFELYVRLLLQRSTRGEDVIFVFARLEQRTGSVGWWSIRTFRVILMMSLLACQLCVKVRNDHFIQTAMTDQLPIGRDLTDALLQSGSKH